jgi:hypothetical protein
VERLRKVREAMKGLKESGQAIGAHSLSRLGDFAPPTLLAQASRLQAVTRMFNLVVTNVPGPQFPLYLLGKRMLRCFPQVPLAAQQAVGVALLSYDGHIGVGLVGDSDAAQDLSALAAAMRPSLDELKVRSTSKPDPNPNPDPATARAPAADSNLNLAPAQTPSPAPAPDPDLTPSPASDPARTPGI